MYGVIKGRKRFQNNFFSDRIIIIQPTWYDDILCQICKMKNRDLDENVLVAFIHQFDTRNHVQKKKTRSMYINKYIMEYVMCIIDVIKILIRLANASYYVATTRYKYWGFKILRLYFNG